MNRAPRLMAIRALEDPGAARSRRASRAPSGGGLPARERGEPGVDTNHDPGGGLGPWAVGLARAGVDCLQIRDKRACDQLVYEGVRSVVEALAAWRTSAGAAKDAERPARPVCVLVNRRPDISSAGGGQGVHLPANGLPTRIVRRAFGEDFVLGRSTHSVEEVAQARREGADYVVFGPVFETPEKLRYGAPLGLDQLARACELGIPVLAIGGITDERLEAVARAGASGAAAIRWFEDAGRAAALVERATDLFDRIRSPAHA